MSAVSHPQRIQSVHVESIDGELCIYDTARERVHSLNRTAAVVWQRCDGRTSPAELAAILSAEMQIDDAEAVVRLTLKELADAQLLTAPIDDVAPVSRRDLLRHGVAAAAIPAIYSIVAPLPAAAQSPLAPPTLTGLSPAQGVRGTALAVTLTGTNFVVGATTVNVSGAGITAKVVAVSSSASLTAVFVLDPAAAVGPRTVTVTTAGGTSGQQTFTVSVPPGSATFTLTGGPELFTVPAGVVAITIEATGAAGVPGFGDFPGAGGLGGRTRATVSVTSGASLTVLVGGPGVTFVGGFNGGGGSTGVGGGGGGASSVRNGATPLVVAGGGGGGGAEAGGPIPGGNGGAGGGLIAEPGQSPLSGGGGGGGGTQVAGGAGGAESSFSGIAGTAGLADQGGIGGNHQPGVIGGGGGGGGYFGGGGGGGGNPSTSGGGGGGGGSSFTAPGATGVLHQKGVNSGAGSVTISW